MNEDALENLVYFQTLKKSTLIEREGCIFLTAQFKENEFCKLRTRGISKRECEAYINHVHLLFIVNEHDVQLEIANILKDSWENKAKEAKRCIIVEIDDNGENVDLYLYSKQASMKS